LAQSNNYWRRREEENLRANRKTEAEYEKAINDTYKYMLDQIQKEINGFYAKYARAEGITLSEAKRRVSKIDIEEYGRKAARYVKTKDFSKQANDEMRLYNATMKINRLELLKANIGLELVAGFDELQKYFEEKLTNRTMDEFKRQSGILGRTVQNNEKAAHAIVNASFKNATYSDRIWMYQGMLKAELDSLLKTGLIQGKHPTELARHLQKRFGVSAYNANRLMTTELARVQTEAQKQSFIRNGFTQYTFLAIGTACEACRALNEKHFDIDKMMPGENAPPMHPNCRCSVAAYMDSEEYEAWIETYKEHGMSFEEWKQRSPVANTGSYEKAFYTKDDPIREYIGAAEKSHPQELREMKEDMERSGVDITRRAGAMGYFPGLSAGKVGNINIEEGASISAWMHEYKHFCDDRADGYLGFRIFQNPAKCADRERQAYQVEIDFAKELGYNDIVKRLEKLRDEEVEKYEQ
jgi:SPP1 gp7 family putative phage head morphogenesis protein